MADDGDVLSDLDPILAATDSSRSPWKDGKFWPDMDLARKLLQVPIKEGSAQQQESGRVAKALDAWIAHELRRAGFPGDGVWPRASRPRVQPADLAEVHVAIDKALLRLDELEKRLDAYEAKAQAKGLKVTRPKTHQLRPGISNIRDALPGSANAEILGRFYAKQVDVVVSTWRRGPDVLVSTKTQFSSYLNNKNNRYEEAVGEGKNLRDRHPLAAMGFAYLVRTNIFKASEERGAFEYLRNQLVRLRRPDGFFDATMLLAADWDDATLTLNDLEDPTTDAPTDTNLSAPKFFEDLIHAVLAYTPVDLHPTVRYRQMDVEPLGGVPEPDESVAPEEAAAFDADA